MLTKFPVGPMACVSDSFDIFHACEEYWGTQLRDLVVERGSKKVPEGLHRLVIRPDSGEPAEIVPKVGVCVRDVLRVISPKSIQSSAVITRSNIVRYYTKDYRNCGRISIRCWIHKRHMFVKKLTGCFNIKMSSYQYRDPHVKDGLTTVLSSTWESLYLGKMVLILRQDHERWGRRGSKVSCNENGVELNQLD